MEIDGGEPGLATLRKYDVDSATHVNIIIIDSPLLLLLILAAHPQTQRDCDRLCKSFAAYRRRGNRSRTHLVKLGCLPMKSQANK